MGDYCTVETLLHGGTITILKLLKHINPKLKRVELCTLVFTHLTVWKLMSIIWQSTQSPTLINLSKKTKKVL